jgi:hypothetical protein
MFNILMGTFVKKRVCVCVRVRACMWWKSTQSFANTMDNVRNILKRQYLFVCFYVLFVKSEMMMNHIMLQIVCF